MSRASKLKERGLDVNGKPLDEKDQEKKETKVEEKEKKGEDPKAKDETPEKKPEKGQKKSDADATATDKKEAKDKDLVAELKALKKVQEELKQKIAEMSAVDGRTVYQKVQALKNNEPVDYVDLYTVVVEDEEEVTYIVSEKKEDLLPVSDAVPHDVPQPSKMSVTVN